MLAELVPVRENLFHDTILASGGLLEILSDLWLLDMPAQSLLSCLYGVLCVCVQASKSPSFLRLPHRPHYLSDNLLLTWLFLERFYFQIKSHSELLGSRNLMYHRGHSSACRFWTQFSPQLQFQLASPSLLHSQVIQASKIQRVRMRMSWKTEYKDLN